MASDGSLTLEVYKKTIVISGELGMTTHQFSQHFGCAVFYELYTTLYLQYLIVYKGRDSVLNRTNGARVERRQ